jgi:PPOX class probable F420-dependent enzyme
VNRRAAIAMTDAEASAFLAAGRIVTCATNGHDGWPHLMPLWYVLRDGEPWGWTYAKSQKVRNLERDPRCTLQLEDGNAYAELRGLMLACEAVIHRDPDAVAAVGAELAVKYGDGQPPGPEARAAIGAQARKRVALQFGVRRRASFDHRKLGAAA